MNEIMDDFSSGLIGFWVFLARGEIFTSVLTLSRDLDVIVLFISEYSAPISLHMIYILVRHNYNSLNLIKYLEIAHEKGKIKLFF